MILQWGRLHDLQAGLSAFIPIIAEEGFYMQFGEQRWEGYADFERHQITKRKFFDELHDYTDIRISVGDTVTAAKTHMQWTCRHRPENSPVSCRIKAHIEHTWEFRRCARLSFRDMWSISSNTSKASVPTRPGSMIRTLTSGGRHAEVRGYFFAAGSPTSQVNGFLGAKDFAASPE